MTWIVTGGAGYIGAHVVRLLSGRGDVVVLDDFSTGRPERLPGTVTVVQGSVTDPDDLGRLFARVRATGVIHLAASKAVPESTAAGDPFWLSNVGGVRMLVEAMAGAGVGQLLFASSAAVYGDTGRDRAGERRRPRPVNPYGVTKLEGERILGAARLRSLALRQFNVIGAGPHPSAADTGPASLLPAVFRALTEGTKLVVRGDDYPTPDGSAIRDYVHVRDVAHAYLRGVELLSRRPSWPARRHAVVNVGSGRGTSVLDLVGLAGRVAGAEVPFRVGERRPGDAAESVADVGRARRMGLGPRHSLEEAVSSAWKSWRR
ncbi:UDP-glucose 4-epimerase GalE [Paractinoplanes deccanensis]|uniref:UDP-glucose 4-epimerase n=1 Tax=Paractinoplanes deccanensis TaxID=113561 RepID=A0ABQ3YBR8_9ACTN|nr:NAD-dependent epimerase/dehydratase family protein [Actinoplanes deccanensis]GID77450.1 UDP-glucose 4-epimerase GalE [Actinoplanes deccanensis]